MKENMKDVLLRSAKTFWQAALAYLVTTFGTQLSGIGAFDLDALSNALFALLVGAVAAGCSAAWNGVAAPFLKKLTDKEKPPDSLA